MELSRQKYWSGLPFPSPGDLPNPGIKPGSSTLRADYLPSEPPEESVNGKWKWKSLSRVQLFATPRTTQSMGILQARILEWVALPFSRGSSQPKDWTQVSHIAGRFFTVWATRGAQEYWSGWSIPSPGDPPDPGIKPGSPALQADSLPAELPGKTHGVYSLLLFLIFFRLYY